MLRFAVDVSFTEVLACLIPRRKPACSGREVPVLSELIARSHQDRLADGITTATAYTPTATASTPATAPQTAHQPHTLPPLIDGRWTADLFHVSDDEVQQPAAAQRGPLPIDVRAQLPIRNPAGSPTFKPGPAHLEPKGPSRLPHCQPLRSRTCHAAHRCNSAGSPCHYALTGQSGTETGWLWQSPLP